MTIKQEVKDQILQYFTSTLTITDVASIMKVSVGTVHNVWRSKYSDDECKERRSRLMSGENHPNWKGGVTTTAKGYRYIYAPDWYEGYTDDYGRAPEHMVKWCEYNNKKSVPHDHIVHHRNEDKGDNSPDNLELLSKSEHTSTHASRRIRDYNGQFV